MTPLSEFPARIPGLAVLGGCRLLCVRELQAEHICSFSQRIIQEAKPRVAAERPSTQRSQGPQVLLVSPTGFGFSRCLVPSTYRVDTPPGWLVHRAPPTRTNCSVPSRMFQATCSLVCLLQCLARTCYLPHCVLGAPEPPMRRALHTMRLKASLGPDFSPCLRKPTERRLALGSLAQGHTARIWQDLNLSQCGGQIEVPLYFGSLPRLTLWELHG